MSNSIPNICLPLLLYLIFILIKAQIYTLTLDPTTFIRSCQSFRFRLYVDCCIQDSFKLVLGTKKKGASPYASSWNASADKLQCMWLKIKYRWHKTKRTINK